MEWAVWHADIGAWQAPRKYDLVITDPPYGARHLPLYDVLFRRAPEWLEPHGLLVLMCGTAHLPEILRLAEGRLRYLWLGAYRMGGRPAPALRRREGWLVFGRIRPVLMFARDPEAFRERAIRTRRFIVDEFISPGPEKRHHRWQLNLAGMLDLVGKLCRPGDWVLDPFCGSGTTGVAALLRGCSFHGIDRDPAAVAIARRRLMEEPGRILRQGVLFGDGCAMTLR